MPVAILKQGETLVVSLNTALTDTSWRGLQERLVQRVGEVRARAVVLDVSVMDVMDSFATRTLQTMVSALKLRGVRTVVVGIQPDVAFAMVQLGLRLEGTETAQDLEEGLERLERTAQEGGA